MDEVTEAVGISGEAPVFRGACLRVLTVVCEDMTPQSDLWRLWKRKLTRVATHSESPRLHSLQRRHQRRQSGGRGGVGQFRRQTCPETLHSRGRGTPRIALCTPITSGDGEGTWEVRRRHAPAPPESAVLAGVKKAGRRISVQYVNRESLANHVILQIFALPTRRSSARAWVATPPCPSSPLLRLPTSATGWRE